jgi:pimeloyl-ACP methyl ester carboxylesterase
MPLALRAVALGILTALDLAARPCPAAPALPLSACELEHPLLHTVLAAECGVLSVPENPHLPDGRQISLSIARVAAISRRKQPDPLFVLAGGPGQAAASFYTTVAGAFARILRERDIVLLDQRGTGGSNRLDCREDEDFVTRQSEAQIASDTRECLAALAPRADVAYYTTSLAVQDLERVRQALGYPRINLYGASYGTRVAQQYLRRYPGRVRSVILDGVVPAELILGPAAALDAQAALEDILARCAAAPGCRDEFADPAGDYRAVHAALSEHAVAVSVANPQTGSIARFELGADQLATVLRLGSYSSDYAALLPFMLHAAARADYTPLAQQFLFIEHTYGGRIATAMNYSVVCAEDMAFFDAHALDRAALAGSYMGTTQLDALQSVCRNWPRGPVDADLHAPLTSAVPALLLSGSADPVTPPTYARQAARGFPHSLSIVLEGFGHGQLTVACMDRVMAQFLMRASVSALDVSCTKNARPMAFFTSLNGPPP